MLARRSREAARRVTIRAVTLDDMDEVLARLESGPVAGPARLAWEPTTPLEAVRAWAQARGMKRGAHPTPQVKHLALDYQRHAKEAGWALDWLPLARIGLELGRLGLTRCSSHGKRSYLVDEASAKALWLAAPAAPHHKRRPPRKHLVKHRRPEAFFPLKASRGQPVVNTLGRVYPSARRAAALLRTSRDSLQRAARHGEGCNGLLWRYLTPDEVRCIPPTTLVGDAIPWLAWNRVVSVHCPSCGVASTHDGRADGQRPPGTLPPGSPTGVASHGGGSPTHIP